MDGSEKSGMRLDWEGLEQGSAAGSRGLSQEVEFHGIFPSGCSQIPKSQALPRSPSYLSTCFPSFPSPGLSFYTRVLENCEDEAKFDEVGEVFHPFYPKNPTCFPGIPCPGEDPGFPVLVKSLFPIFLGIFVVCSKVSPGRGQTGFRAGHKWENSYGIFQGGWGG